MERNILETRLVDLKINEVKKVPRTYNREVVFSSVNPPKLKLQMFKII